MIIMDQKEQTKSMLKTLHMIILLHDVSINKLSENAFVLKFCVEQVINLLLDRNRLL